MDRNESTAATTSLTDAGRIARRIELERKLARLPGGLIDDPTLATTAILILAAVSMVVIMSALHAALH